MNKTGGIFRTFEKSLIMKSIGVFFLYLKFSRTPVILLYHFRGIKSSSIEYLVASIWYLVLTSPFHELFI